MSNARRKMRKRAWAVCFKHGKSIGLTTSLIAEVLGYQVYKRDGIEFPPRWEKRYKKCIDILDITYVRISTFKNLPWFIQKKLGGLSKFMRKNYQWYCFGGPMKWHVSTELQF